MSENEKHTLSVKLRTRAGKGAARAERRNGNVPGVIYGDNKPPVLFSISSLDLNKALRQPGFRTHVFEIDVEGEKHNALCQDIQRDLILNHPIHLDFLRVNKAAEIRVEIPLTFVNEDKCLGVKAGGTLNIVEREIAVLCKPDAIPEKIEVDLLNLGKGDSFQIKDITFPAGVKPEEAEDFTLVTIHAPSSDDTGADAAEGAASASDTKK